MTEKGLTCHKSSLQIAGNVCYMPAASPSVATECLLCISRGNCRRTTFAIFFMSKVGNLWNRISPLPRESFYFDTERRLPVTTMLLCFDTSTLYSVTTRTWLIINESSWRMVTFFFTKHLWTIQWHWLLSLLWQCLVSRHRVGQEKAAARQVQLHMWPVPAVSSCSCLCKPSSFFLLPLITQLREN